MVARQRALKCRASVARYAGIREFTGVRWQRRARASYAWLYSAV